MNSAHEVQNRYRERNPARPAGTPDQRWQRSGRVRPGGAARYPDSSRNSRFRHAAARSAALVATTRIGAEFARAHPLDTSGIQSSMHSAMSFAPPLSFPASFTHTCECDDGTPIACSESCATLGRPSPNRMFISITASQAFTPLVPWPAVPATLTSTTQVRVQ